MPAIVRRVPWLGGSAGLLLLALVFHGISCADNTESPQVAAIRIDPAETLSLLSGESYQLKAIPTDSRGSALSGIAIIWSSTDSSVATVNVTGVVTALTPGNTLILASADTATGLMAVAVLPPLRTIAVAPPEPELLPGQTIQLVATAEGESDGPITDRPVEWGTSDSSVAIASPSGLLTGVSPGSAVVTATASKKTATAPVTVLAPIATLEVKPSRARLHPGESAQYSAASFDSRGGVIQGRPIEWTVSDPDIATVSEAGVVTALQEGTAFIIAEAEGQQTRAILEVEAAVRSLKLEPEQVTLRPGATQQFNATLKDEKGQTLSGREIEWRSSDHDVATVSAQGLVQGARPGHATITATSEGKVASSSIRVEEAVATVTLKPGSRRLVVGEQFKFVATLRDASGRVLTGRRVEWSSEHFAVAGVSASGQVTGRAVGRTTIEATSEGVDGEATVEVWQPDDAPIVLVGAGDVATCTGQGDDQTARLLDGIPGTVFLAGDNAYPSGSDEEYANCYEPTWGRHKWRTRPVPGNREYLTPGAQGYFNYFGPAAGDPATGYYSYDLGEWHVLALNTQFTGKPGSPQAEWVKADLAAHPKKCMLAIWHVPLFGPDSVSVRMHYVFDLLQKAGAELVINGHEHNYQRYAPQTVDGVADPERGIRQIIVGTGGKGVGIGDKKLPNREVAYGGGFGVLKLSLYRESYSWEFISVPGKTFTDSGSAACH